MQLFFKVLATIAISQVTIALPINFGGSGDPSLRANHVANTGSSGFSGTGATDLAADLAVQINAASVQAQVEQAKAAANIAANIATIKQDLS